MRLMDVEGDGFDADHMTNAAALQSLREELDAQHATLERLIVQMGRSRSLLVRLEQIEDAEE